MNDISRELNLSVYSLNKIYFAVDKQYKVMEKKKRNGESRILAAPGYKLKAIQYWILRNILEKLTFEKNATAFKKGQSIKRNIEVHRGKEYFLCLDIEDFFGSINRIKVYKLFRSIGYNHKVSSIFARFCTYKGSLPQGGVTSPYLSNLLNIQLDRRINGYLSQRSIIYSRYADDIVVSSNHPDKLIEVKRQIEKIIEDEGYVINKSKTRLLRPGNQRKIVGLVYSDYQEIGIGRKKKRIIRSKIFNYEKNKEPSEKELQHILGWMSFIKDVDPKGYSQLSKFWNSLKQEKEEFAKLIDVF